MAKLSTQTGLRKHSESAQVPFLDKSIAAFLIMILSPVALLNCLISLTKSQALTTRSTKTDMLGREIIFVGYSNGWLKQHAMLWTVIKGECALVGIPMTDSLKDESLSSDSLAQFKPGLLNIAELYRATGLSSEMSGNHVTQQCQLQAGGRLKFILQALISKAFYTSTTQNCKTNNTAKLFGLILSNIESEQAVDWLVNGKSDSVSADGKKGANVAFYINAHSINLAYADPEYHTTLSQADRLFSDGSGMRIAAQRSGQFLKANLNGTDMLPQICAEAEKQNKSLYLLGAKPGIAEMAAFNLMDQFQTLEMAGWQHGFFDADNCQAIIDQINAAKPDILLVGLGSPIQESWVIAHRDELECECIIAVGGLFDFFSGQMPRAPLAFRQLGMEWVWRLMQEPKKKFFRYVIGNPLFLARTYTKQNLEEA